MLAVFFFFCFSAFLFSLVSPVFVQSKLLFCKALSLVILVIAASNKIDIFYLVSIICCSLRSAVNPSSFFKIPKMLTASKFWADWKIKAKMAYLLHIIISHKKAFPSARLHTNLQVFPCKVFWSLLVCLILHFYSIHNPYAHTTHNPLDVSAYWITVPHGLSLFSGNAVHGGNHW